MLTVAHVDHNAGNNDPDNLAWLCGTHHWMFDAALYPIAAIRILREHWQKTQGRPDHAARMQDAGLKAALTRARRIGLSLVAGSAVALRPARKAVATRRARAPSSFKPTPDSQ